eukprot:gnl/TRDRNA2_/TRDRNA2_151214_c0_seq2.p1 gnl/TRDRNA2_/TRDRNA2_151214_c0~~gnl/TRDRNA2_/TRDRNA2_151214_c0_seq2.p1  ORF type:complete len:340 (-),score=65.68 gnl/TRDRNA2_/TRDRNA2_151214_c0_seq2:86-1105(-)
MVESMPEDPCEWGMTVKQLLEFGAETLSRSCEKLMDEDDLSNDFCDLYEMNNKGENISELKGPKWINMYDTVTQYVKPLTKEANLSLAVFLNKECPKKATVFISHSWAEKLLYFVCILCGSLMADTTFGWIAKSLGWKHGMLSPETVIWVCAFAINQNANIQGELGGDVLQSPFAKVLTQCDKVVVLFNMSRSLYTRVWCVLEMYLATKKQADEPIFIIEAVGVQGKDQTMDKEWVVENFKDEYEEVNKKVQEDAKDRSFFGTDDNVDLGDSFKEEIDRWSTKYVEENPMRVANAQASVEQDRIDILKIVTPIAEEVDDMIAKMRISTTYAPFRMTQFG